MKNLQKSASTKQRKTALSAELNDLQKWAEGKPVGFVLFATQVAMAAEECHTLLAIRNHQEHWPGPLGRRETQEWQRLFGSHRQLRRGLMASFGANPEEIQGIEVCLNTLTWFSRADRNLVASQIKESLEGIAPEDLQKDFQKGNDFSRELLDLHWEDLADEVSSRKLSEEESNLWQAASRQLPVRFFFRSAFPCWIHYGEWPSALLYRATRPTRPDLKALESLVRLDKHVVHHPLIARTIHPINRHLRQSRLDRVAKALRGQPRRITRKGIKLRLSRLILQMGERFGVPLTTPDLRQLFDCVARLRCQPAIADNDLSGSPEAFLKAVKREPGFWKLPPKPDMKIWKRVRALWK